MHQRSRELIYSSIAILVITILYLGMVVIYRGSPAASGFYGHSMGIVGFLLMLMTETLYTLRKRLRQAWPGRMSEWLEFHIFTGLVGPYMVLLHTSWKFNGLAGVLSLLTLVIVASGFIGRYIYTAIPRTADGTELSLSEIEDEIRRIEIKMVGLDPEKTQPFPGTLMEEQSTRPAPKTLRRLKALKREEDRLRQQVSSLAAARRMMAVWHTVHIPLGLTLFVMAFIHIGAAIYYATLLR